jgi:hypothetical protein
VGRGDDTAEYQPCYETENDAVYPHAR